MELTNKAEGWRLKAEGKNKGPDPSVFSLQPGFKV
jgi:hypothetical protein